MSTHKLISVIVAVTTLGWGVQGLALQPETEPESAAQKLVEDNNQFAFNLYRQLAADEPGNLFFSPYSISTAFAMTYAGARNETARQMAEAMVFNLPDRQLHQAFEASTERIQEIQAGGEVELSVANALWPQQDYPFLETYLSLIEEHYGARVTALDYVSAAEAARQTINQWVEEQTRDRIQNLIPAGVLTPLTRMVLVNAIYFKGDWKLQFATEQTRDAPFYPTPEQTVQVPMMYQKAHFRYAALERLQLLELPYRGDQLSMLILLPKPEVELTQLEAEINAESIAAWHRQSRPREVNVFLPRFKTTSSLQLNQPLIAMGMRDAFNASKADFSGMDGRPDSLYISAVLHKAFIEVNEEGSEAAAATAVIVATRAVTEPPPEFRADRPFLFMIRENHSGAILFLGRLQAPSSQEE